MFKTTFRKKRSPRPATVHSLLPSIWLSSFQSFADWTNQEAALLEFHRIADTIDDGVILSRHRFSRDAWCSVCQCVTSMSFAWYYSHPTLEGSVQPAWTETFNCQGCGINSRMRALISMLQELDVPSQSRIYTTEATTDGYQALKKLYPNTLGSEYLGPNIQPGTKHRFGKHSGVLHQDLTRLSFDDRTFDLVISQEVFEHIPDYTSAFKESWRVLRDGGRLIFTIPFFQNQASTVIRARLKADGEVEHLLPAIYHGNPVDKSGSLVFQDFGWDILDDIRKAGFAEASAHLYWGPWQGHMGSYFFVFVAHKR